MLCPNLQTISKHNTCIKDRVIVRTHASPTFIRHICVNIITAVQTECKRAHVDSPKDAFGCSALLCSSSDKDSDQKNTSQHLMSWCLLRSRANQSWENTCEHWRSSLPGISWEWDQSYFTERVQPGSEASNQDYSATEGQMWSATIKGHFSVPVNKEEIKKQIKSHLHYRYSV